jgi:hypothetical protein
MSRDLPAAEAFPLLACRALQLPGARGDRDPGKPRGPSAAPMGLIARLLGRAAVGAVYADSRAISQGPGTVDGANFGNGSRNRKMLR